MKKTYLSLLLLFIATLITTSSVYAVTKTISPTTTASPSAQQNADLMNKIDQQIKDLKDKIVSRTAELNLIEKRGIIGTVTETSGTEIQLTDKQNNLRFVDVDELTKFSSASAKDIGISDLTKGTLIGVLGNYNKDSKRILARFVSIVTFPQTVNGTVNTIDKKNYQFTITTTNQKSQLIDVENVTKTSVYSADTGLKKAGFSKIATDEHVYVIGFPDKKNPDMLIASRIILFPDLSPNSSPSAEISDTPTPGKY